MAYRWLCISTHENVEITKKTNIWGVSQRYFKIISKVNVGDTLLMYNIRRKDGNNTIPSLIVGVFTVESKLFEDNTKLFVTPKTLHNEVFPFRIKVKPDLLFDPPIEFKPLIKKLSFIKNKQMWTGSLRTAMKLIPEADYKTILAESMHVK